jgi:hypothetical protein
MAHLIQIHPAECQQCVIPTRAQFELRDTKNALRGLYCEKHGRRALDKLHADENPMQAMGAQQ